MIEILTDRFSYAVVLILMMIGLYAVIASANLVKRLVALSIFQTSVFLLYITTAKVFGGEPPILPSDVAHGDHVEEHLAHVLYANPLPHVLILTAIVVGVSTLAMGLALVVRIREAYGTIEDVAIAEADYSDELERGA